jgi:NADH-quinone oxidoreductase E subunit
VSELIQLGATNARPKPPRPEDLQLRFSAAAIKQLDALRTHYPEEKACILPALWIAQREYGGYLSGDAIAEVAYRLHRSYAEVEGVATFYSMYNTEHKPGRHKIEVCTCLSCHVCGAYRIADYLKAKLGINNGETTADGLFTIEEVECLDACDRAPLLQIGDEYYGPVTESDVDKLIENLRNSSESTVTKLADEIVKVQITANEYQESQS